MLIAGFDPGSRMAGFALLNVAGATLEIVEMGAWNLVAEAGEDFGDRLCLLHSRARDFLKKHNPHVIGLEKAVAFKNISSAFKLSESRAMIRLAAHQLLADASERFVEISPTEVKRSAAGLGMSSKQSIERALRLRFPASKVFDLPAGSKPLVHDAFDAVAIAWAAKSKRLLTSMNQYSVKEVKKHNVDTGA